MQICRRTWVSTAVASMRRTEALASVKFYQILSIFIFFIRLIILEDFIRLISYNGPCVRLGCSFFLATALVSHSKLLYGSGSLSESQRRSEISDVISAKCYRGNRDTKIMTTFFQDQIWCQRNSNGGVLWIEVFQRRVSTVVALLRYF